MIREKRRRKARLKVTILAVLSLILAFAIAAVIVVKVFVVKNVKVEGNVLYDESLIKSTVFNDDYSRNSLYVFLKYTFVDTEELPFIDTMEIRMDDPQSLTIKVYEKGMMGYIYIPAIGENAYFDKDGFVVETSTRIIEDVPRVEGLACEEVVLYEKLPIDKKLLKELLTLTQTLKRPDENVSFDLVPDAIEYGVVNEPVLHYGNVEVNMGSIEYLTQKVEHLEGMFQKTNGMSGMSGILHLENWTGEKSNVVFEMKE